MILIPLPGFWPGRYVSVGEDRVRRMSAALACDAGTHALYVAIGIALWRPLPIVFSPTLHIIILVIGSLLYFPGIALYLWGYRTLGHMFSISSGFGATLYQDHRFIRSGRIDSCGIRCIWRSSWQRSARC